MQTFTALGSIFFRKLWREHLLLVAFFPIFVACSADLSMRTTGKNHWYFIFLLLPVVAASLTSGIIYDDLPSRNVELLRSREISGSKVLFCRLLVAFLFGQIGLIAAFMSGVLLHLELSTNLLLWISCTLSITIWLSFFSLLSGFLNPRFNWLLIVLLFFLLPHWGSPTSINSFWVGSRLFFAYQRSELVSARTLLFTLTWSVILFCASLAISRFAWKTK
jgi:hypothetical protein